MKLEKIPRYYISVSEQGTRFYYPVVDGIGFVESANGAWMRAGDVERERADKALIPADRIPRLIELVSAACREAAVTNNERAYELWTAVRSELNDAKVEPIDGHWHVWKLSRIAGEECFCGATRPGCIGPVSLPSTTPQKSDAAKREHWRQWAIDGMPADKMRLAEATWEAAASALSATACSDRDKILCDAVADAARWHALKELAGYYQDGSQTTVKLYQDDALRSCFIEAGNKTYGTDGSTFDSAIDEYINRADGGKQT